MFSVFPHASNKLDPELDLESTTSDESPEGDITSF